MKGAKRLMSENNIQRNERKRRNRRRPTYKIIAAIILIVVALITSIHFLFGENNSPSSVIVNSTDNQKNQTISNSEPEGNDNLQSTCIFQIN